LLFSSGDKIERFIKVEIGFILVKMRTLYTILTALTALTLSYTAMAQDRVNKNDGVAANSDVLTSLIEEQLETKRITDALAEESKAPEEDTFGPSLGDMILVDAYETSAIVPCLGSNSDYCEDMLDRKFGQEFGPKDLEDKEDYARHLLAEIGVNIPEDVEVELRYAKLKYTNEQGLHTSQVQISVNQEDSVANFFFDTENGLLERWLSTPKVTVGDHVVSADIQKYDPVVFQWTLPDLNDDYSSLVAESE